MRTMLDLGRICDLLKVDLALVMDFADFGLYPTIVLEGRMGIEAQNLERLKSVISLHQALGINKEGIEVILELRARVADLQSEVDGLRGQVACLNRRAEGEEALELERLGLLIEIDAFEGPGQA